MVITMTTAGPCATMKQLHMYVCMMIELKDYALTDKTRSVFELCKAALAENVKYMPNAIDVIKMYMEIPDPHSLTADLCKTNYTDKYVEDINSILTEIMLADTPEELVGNFDQLAKLK